MKLIVMRLTWGSEKTHTHKLYIYIYIYIHIHTSIYIFRERGVEDRKDVDKTKTEKQAC